MKTNYKYLIIGIIAITEILLIWIWIQKEEPDPSVSIALILIIPFLLAINLIPALILWFVKKKSLSKLLAINSIFCSIAFYVLWQGWFANYHSKYYKSWTFELEGKEYEISLTKNSNNFWLSDITNQKNGSTTGLNFGEYHIKGDSLILIDQRGELKLKQRMAIHENKLYRYNSMTQIINLKKEK